MKRMLFAFALIIAALGFDSCGPSRYAGAPPPPRVEVIPVAPSPRHVWVQGYYVKRHRNYRWRPGHYELR